MDIYERSPLPVRKANCMNCHEMLFLDPLWERINCSNCGYLYTTKQQTMKAKIKKSEVELIGYNELIRSRIAVAKKDLTIIQKVFVLIQILFMLYTFSLTKSYLMKLCIRIHFSIFGINGNSFDNTSSKGKKLKSLSKNLKFIIPIIIEILSWFYILIQPEPEPSIFMKWWYPSKPIWPGLQKYVIDLVKNVLLYIIFTELYAWLWGNLVGTLRQNIKKIVLAFILPYFILPHIIPSLSKELVKKILS